MSRFFYIDTENMNFPSWKKHVEGFMKSDTIIFMVSDKSCQIPLGQAVTFVSNLCNTVKVKTIYCQNGTANAMDFCLVATLGGCIQCAPKSQHIIISNDHGYDAVVSLYKENGVNVIRCGSNDPSCLSAKISKKKENSVVQKETGADELSEGITSVSMEGVSASKGTCSNIQIKKLPDEYKKEWKMIKKLAASKYSDRKQCNQFLSHEYAKLISRYYTDKNVQSKQMEKVAACK